MTRPESSARWDAPATRFVRKVFNKPERYLHQVVTDEGLSPEIQLDDVVVIDTEKAQFETGVFVMKVSSGGMFLARLQRKVDGGKVIAIRDYPERDVMELDGEPEVIGRVVMVLRKVV
ncbi:MAG: hypothetical protein ACD_75C01523G0003 [uncultured bacterium]|nr:MAG: hypothetical protein ACD_75C01523G0003 [uncultured bacterium]